MLRLLALAAACVAVLGACPNQCSGHGRCGPYDQCTCFRQPGLYSPYRYGFTGADCSQRTCPLGRAYDLISSSTPGVSPVIFESATGRSNAKLAVVFIETSQSDSFRALRTSKDVVIQIMSVTEVAGAPVSPYGTFAWRYAEDDYFQPEVLIGDYISSLKGYNLVQGNVNSGLYAYWVPSEKDTPSFETFSSEIAVGDTYAFTLNWNEGDTFDSSDSNTAHQLIPCAGRGTCDSDSGKCSCLPGYTGEACQRTVCPNQCSGHGSCQTQLRFASDGLAVNAQAYTAYDSNQQYGCKCDAGYRGPDCSQIECPSGPDVMGADGGAEGMDCSGRGLCDYSSGVCKCFRGYFGERCESQSTLV